MNTQNSVNVETNVSARGYVAWILASLFFAYQYVLRVMPNVVSVELIEKFGFNASGFGTFMGVYYIGYTLFHIPLGVILDRFGPRIIISACMLISALTPLGMIYCESHGMLIAGRILLGLGSSAGVIGVIKVVRLYFPDKFGLMFGISVTIAFLGAIYGGYPAHTLFDILGWDSTMLCLSIAGLILAVFFVVFCPNIEHQNSNIIEDLKLIFQKRDWIYISLLGGLMIGPMEGFADAWATRFLNFVYGFDNDQSSFLPSLIFLGMAVSTPFLGYALDKVSNVYKIVNYFCVSMLACFVMLLFFPGSLNIYLVGAIMLIIGAALSYQLATIHLSCKLFPASLSGLVGACANMIIMLFGPFFHVAIGMIIDHSYKSRTGDTEFVSAIYNSQDIINGLSLIPIGLFLAFLGITFLQFRLVKK